VDSSSSSSSAGRRSQRLAATEIRAQGNRNVDAAIGLLVILQQGDDRPGLATSVPFRVATGPVPSANLARMLSRRAWKSVQLEVEVTSR
jgi:hypothetical protein